MAHNIKRTDTAKTSKWSLLASDSVTRVNDSTRVTIFGNSTRITVILQNLWVPDG